MKCEAAAISIYFFIQKGYSTMAAIIPVPTLSLDGWVYSTVSKADYLIAHFLEAEKSQTHLYGQQVASLQWIIQQKQNNVSDACILIRDTLGKYFSNYLSDVKVDTSFKDDPNNKSAVIINISVAFTDSAGKEFVLNRLLELLDSKLERVLKLNNTGPVI